MEQKPNHRSSPLALAVIATVIVSSLAIAAAAIGLVPGARWTGGGTEMLGMEGTPPSRAEAAAGRAPSQVASCATCGVVESVRALEIRGEGSGAGAVAGGVVGGVVGNQFGHGSGRTAMTVLGAAGGALAGHEVEKAARSRTVHRVTVRMDDGSYRTFSQSVPARIGDRVRVADGALVPTDTPRIATPAQR